VLAVGEGERWLALPTQCCAPHHIGVQFAAASMSLCCMCWVGRGLRGAVGAGVGGGAWALCAQLCVGQGAVHVWVAHSHGYTCVCTRFCARTWM